jgi:demethylmenaquinone methyltransferase/2-methoxy-6-polyprenyl-1,4-benzoquinol methylase
VRPQPGERILDVAAGTGASAAPMAKAGALVTALDISHGMLEEGRKRHADIEFVHGSAEELPFEGDTFDAVTISFGLRNVQNPRAALSEFHRVLKPAGRLVVCEFSQPPIDVVRKGYELYLGTMLPGVAKLASSNPEAYRYLVESIRSWPDQQSLSQWIRTAGFTRVAHRNLTMGVVALHRGRKPTEQTAAMRIARHAQAEEQGLDAVDR